MIIDERTLTVVPIDTNTSNRNTSATTVRHNNQNHSTTMDLSYLKTLRAICKIAIMVIGTVGFICVSCSSLEVAEQIKTSTEKTGIYLTVQPVAYVWYKIVAMSGIITSGIFLVLNFFMIFNKYPSIPWKIIEFACCSLWAVFYFQAALSTINYVAHSGAYIAAMLLGLIAMGFSTLDAYLGFRRINEG